MKRTTIIAVFMLITVGCTKHSGPVNVAPVTATYNCVAGPDETCPSDLWMADYDRLMAMRARYQAPQDVTDQMNGMDARLARDIPPGFYFNVPKKRFVKLPPQGPAVAPTK